MGNGLSTLELDSFNRDGFVVPEYRLPADMLERLQDLSTKLIADNAHLGDEPIACPHVPGSGVQKMKSAMCTLNLMLPGRSIRKNCLKPFVSIGAGQCRGLP